MLFRSRLQLSALKVRFTDKHPRVLRLQGDIKQLEKQLEETPARVPGIEREILNTEYQQLQMKKRELAQDLEAGEAALLEVDARIEANEKRLSQVTEREKRYEDLVREQKEAEELYNQYRKSLFSARTELEVESGRYGAQAEMVSRALVPTVPYRLERIKLALVTLVGGLCLGVSLMFGLEFSDRSLRNVEDAESFLDVPILASVPRIEDHEEMARRRRKKLLITLSVLLVLGVALGAFFTVQYYYPNLLQEQIQELKNFVMPSVVSL